MNKDEKQIQYNNKVIDDLYQNISKTILKSIGKTSLERKGNENE